MNNEVTVILNIYKRPQHLEEQYNSILVQTHKPKSIIIWNNGNTEFDFTKYKQETIFVDCSKNLGVWSRFIMALNSNTEYICLFDDDTIPGPQWLESCIGYIKKYDGLLGTIGVIFKPGKYYVTKNRVGWAEPNETIEEVDIVGHSWFIRRENLIKLMSELPNTEEFYKWGEDIYLSYMLQKHLHLKTYVPPHSKNNLAIWGSQPETAVNYGIEPVAISQTSDFSGFHKALTYFCDKNFETIENKKLFLRNYNNSIHYFLNKIRNKQPFALIRFADGEYSIINNIVCHNSLDNWKYHGQKSMISKHLYEAMNINGSNAYVGIAAPCDDATMYKYYIDNIEFKANLTYANIFCNNNYAVFKNFIDTSDLNIVLISSDCFENKKLGNLNVIYHYKIHERLVEFWETNWQMHKRNVEKLATMFNNTLFIISGGPVGKVMINFMYNINKENTYMDVGSTIDPYTKQKVSRHYQMDGNWYSNHICDNF